MQPPSSYYTEQIKHYTLLVSKYKSQNTALGWLRILSFVLILFLVFKLWSDPLLMVVCTVIAVLAFSFLVRYNQKIEQLLHLHEELLKINTEESEHLGFLNPTAFNGLPYIHTLCITNNDLDLFGDGSLYQLVNRSVSDIGRDITASSLLQVNTSDQILLRQEAITELKQERYWVQTLSALQRLQPTTRHSLQILQSWVGTTAIQLKSTFTQVGRFVLPLVSISILWLYYYQSISNSLFTIIVLLILGVQGIIAKRAFDHFKFIHKINKELKALSPCLEWIESKTFTSRVLKDIQSTLVPENKASHSINNLSALIDKYDYRLNPLVFLPLNFVTWWDLHLIKKLSDWTTTFKGDIPLWYEAVGKIEMLGSYATLAFNRPDWTIPELSTEWHTFSAAKLGHPMIKSEKIITNDFNLVHPNHLALITGSNMAGKSTFLRSIGTNIVLANAGSVVCAQRLMYHPVKVLTSMRLSDNLQEETSTFYAELKKIKEMLTAITAGEKVILLIDEMLRGTNSADRKQGLLGFIKQLTSLQAVAVIASHEPDMYVFAKEYPDQVKAYFFDSIITNDELHFDYKIKEGVTPSANASFLMKKMGIVID